VEEANRSKGNSLYRKYNTIGLATSSRKDKELTLYYVNNDPTNNPGYHHEVHTEAHTNELRISDKTKIGYFRNEIEAVAAAKNIYSDADGCAICCPLAHTG